jgi:hypothetical protein
MLPGSLPDLTSSFSWMGTFLYFRSCCCAGESKLRGLVGDRRAGPCPSCGSLFWLRLSGRWLRVSSCSLEGEFFTCVPAVSFFTCWKEPVAIGFRANENWAVLLYCVDPASLPCLELSTIEGGRFWIMGASEVLPRSGLDGPLRSPTPTAFWLGGLSPATLILLVTLFFVVCTCLLPFSPPTTNLFLR